MMVLKKIVELLEEGILLEESIREASMLPKIYEALRKLNKYNREYIKFKKELEKLSDEADKNSSEVLTQFHSGENQAYEKIIFKLEELEKE